MKIKYTKRKAIVPLCGLIPKGYIRSADQSASRTYPERTYPLRGPILKGHIRFADQSTSWTNPIGMYPLSGPILKGLIRFADLSRRELDVLRQKLIMLVTKIVNSRLQRSITITQSVMQDKRFGINVLCHCYSFGANFFCE